MAFEKNKDVLARSKGFIVGISGEVYEKRISLFNYLYIEKEDKHFVLYRMDHKTNNIRVIMNNIDFERAIEKAADYQKWFGNNKK